MLLWLRRSANRQLRRRSCCQIAPTLRGVPTWNGIGSTLQPPDTPGVGVIT